MFLIHKNKKNKQKKKQKNKINKQKTKKYQPDNFKFWKKKIKSAKSNTFISIHANHFKALLQMAQFTNRPRVISGIFTMSGRFTLVNFSHFQHMD